MAGNANGNGGRLIVGAAVIGIWLTIIGMWADLKAQVSSNATNIAQHEKRIDKLEQAALPGPVSR